MDSFVLDQLWKRHVNQLVQRNWLTDEEFFESTHTSKAAYNEPTRSPDAVLDTPLQRSLEAATNGEGLRRFDAATVPEEAQRAKPARTKLPLIADQIVQEGRTSDAE